MTSFKGRFFSFVMRNRHLLKGQLKPQVVTFESSISDMRADIHRSAQKMAKLPPGVVTQVAEFKPFYAEWVIPDGCKENYMILYFHGGGFVSGNAVDHRNLVAKFTQFLGAKSLVFDYSLAPENPFPAGVNDSVTIYQWVLSQGYLPEHILFAGDSAGAGLQMSCLLKLKELGLPLPAGVVAMSPCVDMTISGESHKTRLKADPCTPKGSTETWLSYYIGDGDPADPIMSPLFGDLSGLPPMIIQVGDHETLLSDSTRFAEKAHKAGVDVTLHVWEGMFHCFPLLAPMFREANEAMVEIRDFVEFVWNN